jgi:ABC-type Mn2+/Zn2+ transport system permease subunit
MVLATVIGAVSGLLGMLISYHDETAAGATMALVAVVIFFIGMIVRAGITRLPRARVPSA